MKIITKQLIRKDGERRIFEGLATVEMLDRQGEITVRDALLKAFPVWMERGAPIMLEHSNVHIGKGLDYSPCVVKDEHTGNEYYGIKMTGELFKHTKMDNQVWEGIENGEYRGLSFGGFANGAAKQVEMADGSFALKLDDIDLYEMTVCKSPAVPFAVITDHKIQKAVSVYSGDVQVVCEGDVCNAKAVDPSVSAIYTTENEHTFITKSDSTMCVKAVEKMWNESTKAMRKSILTGIRVENNDNLEKNDFSELPNHVQGLLNVADRMAKNMVKKEEEDTEVRIEDEEEDDDYEEEDEGESAKSVAKAVKALAHVYEKRFTQLFKNQKAILEVLKEGVNSGPYLEDGAPTSDPRKRKKSMSEEDEELRAKSNRPPMAVVKSENGEVNNPVMKFMQEHSEKDISKMHELAIRGDWYKNIIAPLENKIKSERGWGGA